MPCRIQRSRGLTEQALTRIRMSPAPMEGSGTSAYSSTSGPPCRRKITAFIVGVSAMRNSECGVRNLHSAFQTQNFSTSDASAQGVDSRFQVVGPQDEGSCAVG